MDAIVRGSVGGKSRAWKRAHLNLLPSAGLPASMIAIHMTHERLAAAANAEPFQLIAAAARGNVTAFEHLYRQYSPRIYGLCLRLTGNREMAEDCTQETFIDAWRAD